MWQRIKQAILQHPTFAPLPLFAKMVLLYSSIVFFILIVVSVITVASIHYIMNDSIKEDLESSAQNTVAYLDSYGKVDSSVFVRSNLPNFVTLQIYNGAGKLVLDNCPTHTIKKLSDRHIDEDIQDKTVNALPTTIHGSETTEFSYYKKWDGDDGKSYYLRFSRQPDKENDFITLLSKQLLASILICLALTVLTGMYLMKKSLAPLRIINDTLETIEVNQLDNRITLSDNRNELHDLAVTINQALDRIEYGYKQQQQFISDASHELRTPITVIAGYADLLDRWGKNDPAVLQESITTIKQETEYMRQLIERLLFFARTNSGTLKKHFADINTAKLLQDVYNEVTLLDHDHEITIVENDEATIYAEPGSVKQMLRIFVDNAVKYTPAGGKITLSCRRDGDNVYYSVSDTGIGIPEKDIDRVFERFYRVEQSRAKETGGSGLGLSIAQYIAKGNNAELSLKSKLNEGTTISVIFPIKKEEEIAEE